MANGKILLSQAYVERLGLTDAELAMVISHEMQHAILLHNLKEYEEAIRLEPGWLARPFSELEDAVDNDTRLMSKLSDLNWDQEVEADRAGLAMAWRVRLARRRTGGLLQETGAGHHHEQPGKPDPPCPLLRWRSARTQADVLDKRRAALPPT
ncbi:hypothetical protein LP419_05825 [Massilia sp. H-1]|nr:hypothetical protein LP419_05825 [Massilia sp. H-1]